MRKSASKPARFLRGVWIGVSLLVGQAPATSAWATIDNVKSFKAAYPGKEPKAYSCKVCHQNPIGKKDDLNSYGLALQKFKGSGNALKLTEEDYKAVEGDDADGDGTTNLQELKAGTDPADPASMSTKLQSDKQSKQHEQQQETVRPEASGPKSAEYVGTETCAMCHADIAASHRRSPHLGIAADGPGGLDISCESCHGPGGLHTEAGGGKGVGGLINPSKNPSTCYACHTDKKMEFALQYHHLVPEGRMSCTDCHAPHGEQPTPRAARAQNELCLKCHQQIKGPWVFEHLAMRDGCLSCHQPHGSITTRLLAERDFNLCLKCHFSGLQFQQVGHYAHRRAINPSGMEGANCTGCHRAVHGSNFSKELRTQ